MSAFGVSPVGISSRSSVVGRARLPHDFTRYRSPRWLASVGEIRATNCAEPFLPARDANSDNMPRTPAPQASQCSKAVSQMIRDYLRLCHDTVGSLALPKTDEQELIPTG